jgi:hypothetical protein
LETRSVASDTNATYRESGLISGLKLSPFPGFTPSADIDTSCVVKVELVVTGRQKTWRVFPSSAADVTRFDAVDVNATVVPPVSIEGSELAPFAAFPFGSVLSSVVAGVHEAVPRHVVRTKMSLEAFVSLAARLFDIDANATTLPVLLVDGPAVVTFGTPFAHVALVPQIPFTACDPSAVRSRITGSPSAAVGFTGSTAMFDVPPPGEALNTCTWLTPAEATSPGVSVVVRDVPLTNAVVLCPPLISITDVAVNPEPVIVSVAEVFPPACALEGASVEITGNGFTTGY